MISDIKTEKKRREQYKENPYVPKDYIIPIPEMEDFNSYNEWWSAVEDVRRQNNITLLHAMGRYYENN